MVIIIHNKNNIDHYISKIHFNPFPRRWDSTWLGNGHQNANWNPEWWGDFGQLQIQIKPQSQFEFVPRDTVEFEALRLSHVRCVSVWTRPRGAILKSSRFPERGSRDKQERKWLTDLVGAHHPLSPAWQWLSCVFVTQGRKKERNESDAYPGYSLATVVKLGLHHPMLKQDRMKLLWTQDPGVSVVWTSHTSKVRSASFLSPWRQQRVCSSFFLELLWKTWVFGFQVWVVKLCCTLLAL